MKGHNLVCFLTLAFVPSLCWAFAYTCYPDDSVAVTGLGPDTTGVFAINADGYNCTTTAAADTVNITNCAKDKYILFSFGSYSNMLANQIIGGRNITVVNITCNEITETGHIIDNTFEASIVINETQEFGVTYSVSSDLDKTSAYVGEKVVWSIHFPSEYYLEVDSCTANPGTSYNEATSISLILNYCTENTDLITNFYSAAGIAISTINAFKFYENNNVFLHCLVTVCPEELPDACLTSCHNMGKRQVVNKDRSDSRFRSEIGQVLQIIDPNANGAKPLSGLSITSTMILIALTLASLL